MHHRHAQVPDGQGEAGLLAGLAVGFWKDKSDIAATKQSVTLTIRLTKAGFQVEPMGTEQTAEELGPYRKMIPATDGKMDYQALTAHLAAIKKKYPRSDTVIITPESVTYETMVKTMDATRELEIRTVGLSRTVKLFPTVVVSTVVK